LSNFSAGAAKSVSPARLVEGEHGDWNCLHDAVEERGCLAGAQALLMQDGAQLVDFGEQFAEWIIVPRGMGADREVSFAQGREQVGASLERPHHAGVKCGGIAEPAKNNQERERELKVEGKRSGP